MLFRLPGASFFYHLFHSLIAIHPSWEVSLSVWSGDATRAADLPSLGPHYTSCISLCCIAHSVAQTTHLIDVDPSHPAVVGSRKHHVKYPLGPGLAPGAAPPPTYLPGLSDLHTPLLGSGTHQMTKRASPPLPCSPFYSPTLGSLASPQGTDSSGVTYQPLDQFFISYKKYINTILFEKT